MSSLEIIFFFFSFFLDNLSGYHFHCLYDTRCYDMQVHPKNLEYCFISHLDVEMNLKQTFMGKPILRGQADLVFGFIIRLQP